MNKQFKTAYFLSVLLFFCFFCLGAGETEIEGYPHLKQFQTAFTGSWLSNYDPSLIKPEDFSDIQNMRYTDNGIKGVSGYSDINSTPLATYYKIRNGFLFSKDQPAESYVLASVYNSGETASRIMQNETAIPFAGNFSATVVHTDAAGAEQGRYSPGPQSTVFYCNSKESLVWGGNGSRVGGFINYDPSDSFSYDYSEEVNDPVNASGNIAVLHTVPGSGIDANVMLLLHLDNNVTDSSPTTPHTVTNNNVTFSETDKVFGTHSAVFNGTTAYLTAPDNADFNLSSGIFTLDIRARVDNLTNDQVLYYQKTDIEAIGFTLGDVEPIAGQTITGKISAQTAIVDSVVVTGGSWATNDAVGTIYTHTVSGVFGAEIVTIGGVDSLTLNGDFVDYGDNYIQAKINTSGLINLTIYECYGAGSTVVSLTSSATVTADTWYHIEIDENGNDFYIFIDGLLKGYLSDTSRAKNYISVVSIGYNNTNYYDGYIDEYRLSNVARHTDEFEPPSLSYSTSTSEAYYYLGSTRPLKGFKAYIGTANTSSSSMSVFYWNGISWSSVTTLSDGTAAGGKSHAQAGDVVFDSTVITAKSRFLNGRVLYWYKVGISAVSANTTIYYTTVDAPMQAVKDIWSGDYSPIVSCRKWDASTYIDYTLEVADPDASTVAVMDSLNTTHYMLFGFLSPQQALDIYWVSGKENSNSCNAILYYWSGNAWIEIESKSDGTLSGTKSAGRSGVMSFTGITPGLEFPMSIADEGPFYYYKLQYSAQLDAEVKLNYTQGIPASTTMSAYKFSVYYQNRELLCGREGAPSEILIGAQDSPDVFSGSDSTILNLGSEVLTAGVGIFNRFGSSIYNFAVFTQQTKTWLLEGYAVSGDGQFKYNEVSSTMGCPAPLTMAICEIPYEIAQDALRHIIIWMSYDGPVVFDAGVIKPLMGVEPYFTPNDARCINYSYIDKARGVFDPLNKEYNLFIPSGTSATDNTVWLIYDIMRGKWSKKDAPECPKSGWIVKDTNGAQYTYLGFNDGVMRRNEYGNTFDGTPITQYFVTADFMPEKSIWLHDQLDFLKFVCKAKNTGTATTISAWYRANAADTWTALAGVPMSSSGNRLVQHTQRLNKRGVDHQFKFQAVTSDIADGFEPLALGLMYHTIATDTVTD